MSNVCTTRWHSIHTQSRFRLATRARVYVIVVATWSHDTATLHGVELGDGTYLEHFGEESGSDFLAVEIIEPVQIGDSVP